MPKNLLAKFDANSRLAERVVALLYGGEVPELEASVCLATSQFPAAVAMPPTPSGFPGYDWQYVEGEGLRVFNVELMSYLSAAERPDLPLVSDVDDQFFSDMVALNTRQHHKGKIARIFLDHNQRERGADVIGTVPEISFERPWLRARYLLFTNPTAIGMAARGELPSRSAEFKPVSRHFWGLSFTRGNEGHFEEELPDFRLIEKPGIEQLKAMGTTIGAA